MKPLLSTKYLKPYRVQCISMPKCRQEHIKINQNKSIENEK